MKMLASQIERELQADEWKHCAVYERELTRLWPLDEPERQAKIAQFAKIKKDCAQSSTNGRNQGEACNSFRAKLGTLPARKISEKIICRINKSECSRLCKLHLKLGTLRPEGVFLLGIFRRCP